MADFLLIDFGASRIKAALLINDKISEVQDYPSIAPCCNENKKFEVSSLDIKNKFVSICKEYYKKYCYSGILICSEMHGFMIVDDNNNPLSNYISWKTERSVNNNNFNELKEKISDIFFNKTGMNPRACYPIFNLYDMAKSGEFTGGKIISLPEWLCSCDDKSLNKAHITMSAGLGFYNIYTNKFDTELIEAVNKNISFNKVTQDVEIGGYINIGGKDIPIYAGVGDLQCAVLGAGNTENSISVNLGTGSQVSMINLKNDSCEKSPFFGGKMLSVITHIPSGRMLNCFMNFLKTINPEIDFWKELDDLSVEDINNSDLNLELGIFTSAWNYQNGGAISNINEYNLTKKNYLASLLKNYINQYKSAILELNPSKNYNKIILSGGIPAKIPVVKAYLQEITGYDVLYEEHSVDETLLGLKIISQKYIKKV